MSFGIRNFSAPDAPGYADIVVDRIFESAERLRDFPQSGRIVPEFQFSLSITRLGFRVLPIFPRATHRRRRWDNFWDK